jgi:hypothetical protein
LFCDQRSPGAYKFSLIRDFQQPRFGSPDFSAQSGQRQRSADGLSLTFLLGAHPGVQLITARDGFIFLTDELLRTLRK